MADGTLNFDTKIDSSGFEDGISGLKTALSKFAKVVAAAVSVKTIVEFSKEAIEVASDLQEVQNVVDTAFGDMSYKMEDFADTAITQFGISRLAAKQTGSTFMAMASGMGISSDSASDMAIALTGLSADMASFYNVEQDVASTALKSVFTGETETLKQFGIVMTEANLEAYALSQGISKSISEMTQAEKVQLRYNYVMQQTTLAQGDFAKTSSSWANQTRILSEQWTEFSSVVGSAIMNVALPVVQALNEALAQLITWANAAYNALAEFFGWEKLQSSSGSTIASDAASTADSIESAADSQSDLTDAVNETAEAQENVLAGFDKINKLSDSSSDSSSDSDSDSSVSTVSPISTSVSTATTETLTVDADTSSALKKLNELKKVFGKLKKYIQKTFGGSWKDIWSGLKSETIELFTTLSGIFDDICSLGEPLKEYFAGDFTTFLATCFSALGNIVVGLFDTFNKVFADIWNVAVFPLLQNFTEVVLPFLTQFATQAVLTVGTIFDELKTLFDIFWSEAVVPIMSLLVEIWNDCWESIAAFWDKWGEPIFEKFREAITSTSDTLQNIWNTVIKPCFDAIMAKADEIWTDHLKPLVDNFLDFVGTFVDGALDIYNGFILPVVDWLVDTFGPIVSKVFNTAVDVIGDAIGNIVDVVDGIITALKGVVNFVAGVFTGDWGRAWNGVKGIFSGIWESISNIVATPINFIIDCINACIGYIVDAVNWIIEKINSVSFDVPDWVPEIGGTTVGFDIPTIDSYYQIPKLEVPKLAQGTVVPANYGEFLAVLGDNKREAEVVSPLSTIEQAVRNVTENNTTSDINLTLNLDGKQIYKSIIKRNNESIRMTGRNPLGGMA